MGLSLVSIYLQSQPFAGCCSSHCVLSLVPTQTNQHDICGCEKAPLTELGWLIGLDQKTITAICAIVALEPASNSHFRISLNDFVFTCLCEDFNMGSSGFVKTITAVQREDGRLDEQQPYFMLAHDYSIVFLSVNTIWFTSQTLRAFQQLLPLLCSL